MNSSNRITTCWQINITNNKIFNFTDADEDFIYNNDLYLSGGYFTPGSISSFNELAQDNFTISGVIDDKYITYEMIAVGDFSKAYIKVFLIDLEKLEESKIILKTGWIQEIAIKLKLFQLVGKQIILLVIVILVLVELNLEVNIVEWI